MTAIVLLADIDNVDRFDSAKKFCKYLRTAPRVRGSNNSTHIGPVARQSRSMTCTMLIQSVNHLKCAGSYFTSFYERVRIGKSPGKSRIALVRKTLVAAYFMLKRRNLFYWVDENLYERKKAIAVLRAKRASARVFSDDPLLSEIAEKSA